MTYSKCNITVYEDVDGASRIEYKGCIIQSYSNGDLLTHSVLINGELVAEFNCLLLTIDYINNLYKTSFKRYSVTTKDQKEKSEVFDLFGKMGYRILNRTYDEFDAHMTVVTYYNGHMGSLTSFNGSYKRLTLEELRTLSNEFK